MALSSSFFWSAAAGLAQTPGYTVSRQNHVGEHNDTEF